MAEKRKAILFGDINARYHPAAGVRDELKALFIDEMVIDFYEDYEKLDADVLKNYDLCISYFEFGNDKLTKKHADALSAYVLKGGGLLVLHNGISMQSNYEMIQLLGGKFTGHPDYKELPTMQFKVKAKEHEIMKGIEDFVIRDEQYMFDFDPYTKKTILFEYLYEDKLWPAAWTHQYGLGKVVYLCPGHNTEGFKNPIYRKVISNSVKFIIKQKEHLYV